MADATHLAARHTWERWAAVAGAVCSVAAAVALLALPPEVQPDTVSYIEHYPERAPLYPYLLDLFGAGAAAQVWLARVQAASLVAASAFFALRVGRALSLSVPWRHVLFLMLALPGLKFAAVLLAEPLAYTLVIVFWTFLAEEVLSGRDRRAWLCALCGLGLLLRPQFLFLPVFLGIFLLARAACRRDRASLIGLALLALVMAGAVVLRGAENQARHGIFSSASSGGVHLLSSLLYIAQPEDAGAIADPAARRLFLRSLELAEAKSLTRRHWAMSRSHFDESLVPLVFDVVRPGLGEVLPPGLPAAEAALRGDRLAMSAATSLLAHMPGRFAALLARKVYDGQPFYYALVVISGVVALAHGLAAGSRPAQLYALAALHSCLSYGVILFAGVYSLRYLLPAEAILLALAVAVARALLGPPSGKAASTACGGSG